MVNIFRADIIVRKDSVDRPTFGTVKWTKTCACKTVIIPPPRVHQDSVHYSENSAGFAPSEDVVASVVCR